MKTQWDIRTTIRTARHMFRGPLRNAGLTLVEVMVASTILALGIIGTISMFQWAAQGESIGLVKSKSLALLEARLEAKRAGNWDQLLMDDLDGDGMMEITMMDNGLGKDRNAGDGTFTGSWVIDDVQLVWTVTLDPPGPLWQVGSVLIRSSARAMAANGVVQTFTMGLIRANPRYVGRR